MPFTCKFVSYTFMIVLYSNTALTITLMLSLPLLFSCAGHNGILTELTHYKMDG